jgi:hypothetical protein
MYYLDDNRMHQRDMSYFVGKGERRLPWPPGVVA